MNGEQAGVEHEGERYLQMLGLEHFADREIATSDGSSIPARDFLQICGEHARPVLVGFDAMSPNDPRYEATKNVLHEMIGRYIKEETPD